MRSRVGSVGVVALLAAHGCALSDPPPGTAGSGGVAGGNGGSSVGSGASDGGRNAGGSSPTEWGGSSNGSGGDAGARETGGEDGVGDAGTSGNSAGGTSGNGAATGGTVATGGNAGSVSGAAGTHGDVPCTPDVDDWDNDGWTLSDGDCDDCDDRRSPGYFDAPDNAIDDDCDGTPDNVFECDDGIASDTTDGFDFARAIDLCNMTAWGDRGWGVLDARLTKADGTAAPAAVGHAVRGRFGTGTLPLHGSALALLSTGAAAARGDTNPAPATITNHDQGTASNGPSDFVAAHNGSLTQAGCPAQPLTYAYDPQVLEMGLRAPENARSFSVRASFYAYDFPELVCSGSAAIWVALLDSLATPAPADKNLAVARGTDRTLTANAASGESGAFRQCVNGPTGCEASGSPGTASTCTGTGELAGTGFDDPAPDLCSANSLAGGATGWLNVAGNVNPGEIVTLRIGLWEGSGRGLDATLVLDAFRWSTETVEPGGTWE